MDAAHTKRQAGFQRKQARSSLATEPAWESFKTANQGADEKDGRDHKRNHTPPADQQYLPDPGNQPLFRIAAGLPLNPELFPGPNQPVAFLFREYRLPILLLIKRQLRILG